MIKNSFLKNGISEFWLEALIVFIQTYSQIVNYNVFIHVCVHNKNMSYTKIVITNFRVKLRKLSFILFSQIQMRKEKFPQTCEFWIIKVVLFIVSSPDSVGVDNVNLKNEISAISHGQIFRGDTCRTWSASYLFPKSGDN